MIMTLSTSDSRELITATDLRRGALDQSSFRRAYNRGELIRVKRGAYYPADAWAALDDRRRHIVRMRAVALSHRRPVFGYESAAALLDVPMLGDWTDEVHVIAPRAAGGRSEAGIRRHCIGVGDDEVISCNGLALTNAARTVVDIARARSFEIGVSAADGALRRGLVTPSELAAAAPELGAGVARMRRAIGFADARADNPGESLSRVRIRQLGFTSPALQVRFDVGSGEIYFVDFFWPRHHVIGEFDGVGKYLKTEYLGKRSAGDAVVAEKRREDHLRSAGYVVARWGWPELLEPRVLAGILHRAGLPLARRAPR
jgi:hypothetical protein